MISEEITQLRTHIEARLLELAEQLESMMIPAASRNEALQDEATRFDALATLSIDSALHERVRREIAGLERQLSRLDSGHADECARCGETIPLARLLRVPTAQLCIGCAERQERL